MSMVTQDVEPLFSMQRPTNFCSDGECSGCGNCCSNCLPVTADEIKTIKAYISRHNIKPENHCRPEAKDIDWLCPFRDEKHKRCNIYDVRPSICKFFRCDMQFDITAITKKAKKERRFIDVRMTFTRGQSTAKNTRHSASTCCTGITARRKVIKKMAKAVRKNNVY